MMDNPLRLAALLCGATVWLYCGSAWAMLQNSLGGIEFDSTPLETRIILKSNDSNIPYRIVSQSSEKIVIDVDSIDPSQSVQADFAAANNIEQVILKPIGGARLRMVIRGERMGTPVVLAKTSSTTPYYLDRQVVLERESIGAAKPARINAPDENGNNKSANSQPPLESAFDESVTTPDRRYASDTLEAEEALAGDDSSTLPEEAEDPDSQSLVLPFEEDRKPLAAPENLEEATQLSDIEDSQAATWQDIAFASFETLFDSGRRALAQSDKGLLFRIFALGGLLILLTMFIRRKLLQQELSILDAQDEPSLRQQSRGLLSWFSQGSRKERRLRRPFNDAALARPSSRSVRHSNERPVGLRGLSNHSSMDNPITAEIAPKRVLHPSQAISQYAKNAEPPNPLAPPRDRAVIDHELKRSIQARQLISKTQTRKPSIPGQQMASAKPKPIPPSSPTPKPSRTATPQSKPRTSGMIQPQKAPHASKPLPKNTEQGLPANNTEVLDFLRSVAELMEKDGRPDLAKGVERGLVPQKPKSRS